MDVKELEEANEAIAMLKELDLPISMEQLGKRKMLETKYLNENVIPKVQSHIQSLVEHLHKSFCLVVEYECGEPVQVRLAEQTKIKGDTIQRLVKNDTSNKRVVSKKYKSERIEREWNNFLESLPTGNPFYKYTFTQGYSSLSKLLRIIQSKDMMTYSSSLLKALNLPVNGKLTPTALINVLEPEQLVQEKSKDGVKSKLALWSQSQKTEKQEQGGRIKLFEADEVTPVMIDKTKVIKEGQWSLKLLCDLIAQKEYFANKRSEK
jgi:hypothetical protein